MGEILAFAEILVYRVRQPFHEREPKTCSDDRYDPFADEDARDRSLCDEVHETCDREDDACDPQQRMLRHTFPNSEEYKKSPEAELRKKRGYEDLNPGLTAPSRQ